MADLDAISRLLGQLESSIEGVSRRLDRMDQRMDTRDSALAEMQDILEQQGADARYMKEMLINDVKPTTDDVKRWRLMGMGALAVTGLGAASIGATVYAVLQNLLHLPKLPGG